MPLWMLACLFLLAASSAAWADDLSDCQMTTGDEAIAACDRAIAGQMKDIDVQPYFHRGRHLLEKGEFDRAIVDFSRIISELPNDPASYAQRALAYSGRKDHTSALSDIDVAISLTPDSAEYRLYRGNINVQKEDLTAAEADYRQALKLDAANEDAVVGLALVLGAQGKNKSAIVYFDLAIKRNPAASDAYTGRGSAFADLGEYDKAIADLQQAVALSPGDAEVIQGLGLVRFFMADFAASVLEFRKAVAIDPKPANLVLLHLARARAGEAVADAVKADIGKLANKDWPFPVLQMLAGEIEPSALSAAAKTPGDTCEAHYYLGQSHLMKGNLAVEAKQEFEIAAKTCPPGFTERMGARAELRRLQR